MRTHGETLKGHHTNFTLTDQLTRPGLPDSACQNNVCFENNPDTILRAPHAPGATGQIRVSQSLLHQT